MGILRHLQHWLMGGGPQLSPPNSSQSTRHPPVGGHLPVGCPG